MKINIICIIFVFLAIAGCSLAYREHNGPEDYPMVSSSDEQTVYYQLSNYTGYDCSGQTTGEVTGPSGTCYEYTRYTCFKEIGGYIEKKVFDYMGCKGPYKTILVALQCNNNGLRYNCFTQ